MAKQDDEDEDDDKATADDEGGEAASEEGVSVKGSASLARVGEGDDALVADTDEAEEDAPAAQLGTERYVMAGFFTAGLIGAFILGHAIDAVWSAFVNKDWFVQAVPVLASVGEETRKTYCFIVAGIVALVAVVRTYRRPDVRTWSEDVAGELTKVVWPKKKEVYNSTFIVIVASAMATLYLALLDRLWAFVTNIVYGDGS